MLRKLNRHVSCQAWDYSLIMVMQECWDDRFGEEIPKFMLSWELFVDFGIWEIARRRGHFGGAS